MPATTVSKEGGAGKGVRPARGSPPPAPDTAKQGADLHTVLPAQDLWWAARRWVAAVVIALFPVLFILDDRVTFPVSPVLPGLVFLALVVVLAPFALAEVWLRRDRRRPHEARVLGAYKAKQSARIALIVAFVWFLAWLALGA